MATKNGVLLKSTDNKYCVVVQRFYPQISDINFCNELRISNDDIEEGLKLFIHGRQGELGNSGSLNRKLRFPPHPKLYEMDNIFSYKFGFPKGGIESSNRRNGVICAIRELQQETGIVLLPQQINPKKFLEANKTK